MTNVSPGAVINTVRVYRTSGHTPYVSVALTSGDLVHVYGLFGSIYDKVTKLSLSLVKTPGRTQPEPPMCRVSAIRAHTYEIDRRQARPACRPVSCWWCWWLTRRLLGRKISIDNVICGHRDSRVSVLQKFKFSFCTHFTHSRGRDSSRFLINPQSLIAGPGNINDRRSWRACAPNEPIAKQKYGAKNVQNRKKGWAHPPGSYIATKVRDFGSNLLKCSREQMGTKPAKVGHLAPGAI